MENSLLQLWKDANSPLEYLIALWISSLATLTLVGFVGLFYGIFTGQVDLSSTTWGIFDTLGN
jgi:hypothetical protein